MEILEHIKARRTIRKLRRENPDARLIVTGCAAQTEPETFAAMAEVDAVIGNTGLKRLKGELPQPGRRADGAGHGERGNDRAASRSSSYRRSRVR